MTTPGNAEHRGCSRRTALAAIVLALACGAAACGRDEATSSETVPEVAVSVAAPVRRELPRFTQVTGTLFGDEETTIGALAEKIVAIVGRPVRIETDASRLRPERSEVLRLRGDSSLARELLGWSPAVPLDEGLRRTVAWVRENLDAYAGDGYQV